MEPDPRPSDPDVRLLLCATGNYELTVGPTTMPLSELELSLVVFAIMRMSQRQPTLLSRLVAGLFGADGRTNDPE